MDGGAWWAAVHEVPKSRTWLSDFTFTFHFHALGKEMATHSIEEDINCFLFAWMEEPGGLQSMRSHRVGHDWSDLAAAAESLQKEGKLNIGPAQHVKMESEIGVTCLQAKNTKEC